MKNIISFLSPFEELTRELRASVAFADDALTSIIALKFLLRRLSGQWSWSEKLFHKRWPSIESDTVYCITAMLVPRLKDYYFDTDKKQSAHNML